MSLPADFSTQLCAHQEWSGSGGRGGRTRRGVFEGLRSADPFNAKSLALVCESESPQSVGAFAVHEASKEDTVPKSSQPSLTHDKRAPATLPCGGLPSRASQETSPARRTPSPSGSAGLHEDIGAARREPLAERILDAFPSGSYALSGLLRLMDIVETTSVPTAAVECRVQPRLLINPEFVAAHANTPEKLLMLVMHELHHVLLGHTTLFPRSTPVQNFVFDAVINGLVCRMFPRADYTAFFTDYYREDSFPQCLLRPAPGWPEKPVMPRGVRALAQPHRARVKDVHIALYSSAGATYQEVFEALPRLLDAGSIEGVPLLGGHGGPGEDGGGAPDGQLEHRSPVLFDAVRGIVEQWPQPPDPIRGRSLADVLNETAVRERRSPSNRAILRGLIRKVAGVGADGTLRRVRVDRTEAPTPIPGLGRRSMVLRALGHDPLLHPGWAAWRRSVPSGERVHVYIDVSGSMDSVKGALYGAVLDCETLVHRTVHLFSTKIADITLAQLRRGVCRSTGGTDIDCVAGHMAAHRIRRALIITDGWVGTPRGAHHVTLAGARLAVAYLGPRVNRADLAAVADHTAALSLGA